MAANMNIVVRQLVDGHIFYHEAVREFKKLFLLTALQDNDQNQARTARMLGMRQNTLSRTLVKLGINGEGRPPQKAAA